MKIKIYFYIKYILSWLIRQLRFINFLIPKKEQILIYNSSEVYMNNYALYKYFINNEYNNAYQIYYAMPNIKLSERDTSSKSVDLNYLLNKLIVIFIFMKSKYVFYDNSNIRIPSSKNQKIVNLWHGTPLKKIGFMANSATKLSKNALNCFDKILLSNDVQDDIYIQSFHLNKDQLLHLGSPRNDLIFNSKSKFPTVIKDYNNFRKHIIWMTTYRVTNDGVAHIDDVQWSDTGIPLLINFSTLEQMNQFLKERNILMILKMHNNNSQNHLQNINFSNIRYLSENDFLSQNIQMYELLNETDALITDYSSIYFDYLLTNKPIGFILNDYDNYKKVNGLYYDNIDYYLPGKHIFNYSELENFLDEISVGIDNYSLQRRKINSIFNKYDYNGKNTEKLLEYLEIKKR